MFLAGYYPFVTITLSDRLNSAGRVGRVEVGTARDVGEGAGREQVARCVVGKGPQEVLLLFWRPVVNYRIQGQPVGQHGGGYVDIGASEFFGGNRDIEDGEAGSSVENGDERLGEARLGRLPVGLAPGEERLPRIG